MTPGLAVAGSSGASDHRWVLLEGARNQLLRDLGEFGVTRVEFVAAFPNPAFEVILSPETDAQASTLWSTVGRAQVTQSLLSAGFVDEDLRQVEVRVLPQETADRDYEGSWFHALR